MAEHDVVREITSLVEERRKFEQWIAALDAKRGATPGHVFDRVRADYQTRLTEVRTRLEEFVPRLREIASELEGREREVQGKIREVEDHRTESELRAHVGELSDEAWDLVQREAAKKLGHLGEEKATIAHELAGVRELMAGTSFGHQQPAAAPAPEPVPEPEARPAAADAHPHTHDTPVTGMPVVPETPGFTRSATDSLHAPTPAPSHDAQEPQLELDDAALPRPMTPPAGMRPNHPSLPNIPVVEEFAAEALGEPEEEAPKGHDQGRMSGAVERPVDDSLGIFVQGSATEDLVPARRASKETPLAAHVTSNNPLILKSEGAVGKTLKCSECGAMNVPTEWYCERCGAELAAL